MSLRNEHYNLKQDIDRMVSDLGAYADRADEVLNGKEGRTYATLAELIHDLTADLDKHRSRLNHKYF